MKPTTTSRLFGLTAWWALVVAVAVLSWRVNVLWHLAGRAFDADPAAVYQHQRGR